MSLLDYVGIGEATIKSLAKYGVEQATDLLTMFPKTYKDTRNITSIANLQSGYTFLIEGRVSNVVHKKFGKKFLRFVVTDESGSCTIVMFRFYPNQIGMLENAEYVRCYGKVDLSQNIQMVHPEWAVVQDGESTITQQISAIYRLNRVPDRVVSNIISQVLQSGQDSSNAGGTPS